MANNYFLRTDILPEEVPLLFSNKQLFSNKKFYRNRNKKDNFKSKRKYF